MPEQTVNITTSGGATTATVLEESETPVERIVLYLIKGSYAATLANATDNTDTIPSDVKEIYVKKVVN